MLLTSLTAINTDINDSLNVFGKSILESTLHQIIVAYLLPSLWIRCIHRSDSL